MTESTEEHDTNKKYPPVKPADLIKKDRDEAEATGEDPTSAATAAAMKSHTKVTESQSKEGQ